MAFEGFDEEDGAPLFDSKEAAIERCRMIQNWDPDAVIFIHRKGVPLWLAHLLQNTPLRWIGYKKLERL